MDVAQVLRPSSNFSDHSFLHIFNAHIVNNRAKTTTPKVLAGDQTTRLSVFIRRVCPKNQWLRMKWSSSKNRLLFNTLSNPTYRECFVTDVQFEQVQSARHRIDFAILDALAGKKTKSNICAVEHVRVVNNLSTVLHRVTNWLIPKVLPTVSGIQATTKRKVFGLRFLRNSCSRVTITIVSLPDD